MGQPNPEHTFIPDSHESDISRFTNKFHELLPGVDFEESAEMLEARMAIIEALSTHIQDPELLRFIWINYAKICEQNVDDKTPNNAHPQIRAQFQIAALVHKSLIFRESGDIERYSEDLSDAEEYALTKHLDEIADAIGRELDNLNLMLKTKEE